MNKPADAWPVTQGEGVRVGVLDTGWGRDGRGDNPITGRVLMARDFTGSPTGTRDVHVHGTDVAEIVRSVAPACRILVAKVLADGNGTSPDWVTEGLDWVVANGADVANLSVDLGRSGTFPRLRASIARAVASGVVVVCAAGNTGDATHLPAAWSEVVSVGETWSYQGRWQLSLTSCRGPDLDAVAPSWGVRGLYGTSYASPIVAGAAALCCAARLKFGRPFSTADFRSLLGRTANFVDGYPEPVYGPLARAAER